MKAAYYICLMQKIKYCLFIFSFLIFITSCSDYQKVLKSPNPEYKYERAVEYYEAEEYYKALPLLDELIPLYKGTNKGEKIYFYWCYTNYHLDYLITASYHFKKYAKTYPNSKLAEEALFMGAYCNYIDSPSPTLDQTPTVMAINELQIFINTFPKSELLDSANALIDELELKLETKDFLNSKQYYVTRRYKSAIIALNNTIRAYPNSEYVEEMHLLILKSYYELAINSVEDKKEDRFKRGIDVYYNFIDNFAESKKLNEAEIIYTKLVKAQQEHLKEKEK